MKTLDVEDLPKPVVRALEDMVGALREQLNSKREDRPFVDLPVWEGKVLGRLSRTEIYEDFE